MFFPTALIAAGFLIFFETKLSNLAVIKIFPFWLICLYLRSILSYWVNGLTLKRVLW